MGESRRRGLSGGGPELPGCRAHGPNRLDAIRKAEDAIHLWLETAEEYGLSILSRVADSWWHDIGDVSNVQDFQWIERLQFINPFEGSV